MNVHNVLVITRKEFKDVLRDRRTLIFMLLLPIAVMPLMGIGISKFMKKTIADKKAETLVVAVDPLAESLITGLAGQWRVANATSIGAVITKIGLADVHSVEDLRRIVDRLEKIKEVQQVGGDALGDAALVSFAANFEELPDDEKLLLADAAAVSAATNLIKYIPYDRVKIDGELGGGVEIPEGMPSPLDEPRFTLSIQKSEPIHAAVHVPVDVFDLLTDGKLSAKVHVLHDSSISRSEEAYNRLAAFIAALNRDLVDERLTEAHLSPAFIKPIDLRKSNVATSSRKLQAVIGGFLPYLIIMFCFFGAFYPSLDLTAGEKERHTLETLLLAPVSRVDIAWGKFLVVFTASAVAVVLALVSTGLTLTKGILPQGLAQEFNLTFEPLAIAVTASLFVPVAALFSALLLGVALLARSFKEAQSYTAPLQFLVILPAMSALIPDLEAETHLAWIPFVNVSMLMREQLKGNYLWDFYAITMVSMLLLTLFVLWGAGQLFKRETVLLRT